MITNSPIFVRVEGARTETYTFTFCGYAFSIRFDPSGIANPSKPWGVTRQFSMKLLMCAATLEDAQEYVLEMAAQDMREGLDEVTAALNELRYSTH